MTELLKKRFALPVSNTLVYHPYDFESVPENFRLELQKHGIECKVSAWVPKGLVVASGVAAELMRVVKFDCDIATAMRENAAFLRLIRDNGLIQANE